MSGGGAKLKIAVLGCGRVTQERHAPECATGRETAAAGFYDRDLGRATALCEQYGGRAYESLEEIWADSAVDGVIVCTANATHAPICTAALRAGKHVLCEKPMTVSYEQAAALAGEEQKSSRLFMLAQNQRFDIVNLRAKQLLESGAIGRVLRFSAEFSHGGPEAWSIDAGKTMYFKKDESGLGAVADLGIHKIDLMRWLLETELVELSANFATLDKRFGDGEPIPLEDNALLSVRTSAGQLGTIAASWTNYGCCESAVTLYGTEGNMYISDTNSRSNIAIKKRSGESETYSFPVQKRSGVVDAFAAAAIAGAPSPVSAIEGARGMQVVAAAIKSAATGAAERITPFCPENYADSI